MSTSEAEGKRSPNTTKRRPKWCGNRDDDASLSGFPLMLYRSITRGGETLRAE